MFSQNFPFEYPRDFTFCMFRNLCFKARVRRVECFLLKIKSGVKAITLYKIYVISKNKQVPIKAILLYKTLCDSLKNFEFLQKKP